MDAGGAYAVRSIDLLIFSDSIFYPVFLEALGIFSRSCSIFRIFGLAEGRPQKPSTLISHHMAVRAIFALDFHAGLSSHAWLGGASSPVTS